MRDDITLAGRIHIMIPAEIYCRFYRISLSYIDNQLEIYWRCKENIKELSPSFIVHKFYLQPDAFHVKVHCNIQIIFS